MFGTHEVNINVLVEPSFGTYLCLKVKSYSSGIIWFSLILSYVVDAPVVLAESSASREGAHASEAEARDSDKSCTSGENSKSLGWSEFPSDGSQISSFPRSVLSAIDDSIAADCGRSRSRLEGLGSCLLR